MIRKVGLALAALGALLAVLGYAAYRSNAAPEVRALSLLETNTGRPIVVKIHAQWCGVCLMTRAVWSQIEEKYAGQVNLVVFDLTSDATTAASRAEAARLGLGNFFDSYSGPTGSIAVLDGCTKQVKATIDGVRDFADYQAPIGLALKDSTGYCGPSGS